MRSPHDGDFGEVASIPVPGAFAVAQRADSVFVLHEIEGNVQCTRWNLRFEEEQLLFTVSGCSSLDVCMSVCDYEIIIANRRDRSLTQFCLHGTCTGRHDLGDVQILGGISYFGIYQILLCSPAVREGARVVMMRLYDLLQKRFVWSWPRRSGVELVTSDGNGSIYGIFTENNSSSVLAIIDSTTGKN